MPQSRQLPIHSHVQTLERRIAALERGVRSEALSANYLTVDPTTGVISANFAGVITAQGVTLPEAAGSAFSAPSAVGWQDTAGTLREFLQGALQAGHHGIYFSAQPGTALDVLKDDSGQSAFLQVDNFNRTGSRLAVLIGSTAVNIPLNTAAATVAVNFTVAYNSAPIVVTNPDSASRNIVSNAQSIGTGGFTLRSWWADGAATHAQQNVTVGWIAIGDITLT